MVIDITLRLLIAMLLGGVIGIEREYRSKEAGFRRALKNLLNSFMSKNNAHM